MSIKIIRRILLAGLNRLKLYSTLPSPSLAEKLYCLLAGVLNFSLALPSLICPPIRDFYALSCRYVAGRCRAAYMGIPARASDCEGVLVLHPLYGVGLATALSRMLCRGCVFIDVGAHVGRYALLASRLVGAEGLVVAVEPVPENYAALLDNIMRSGEG